MIKHDKSTRHSNATAFSVRVFFWGHSFGTATSWNGVMSVAWSAGASSVHFSLRWPHMEPKSYPKYPKIWVEIQKISKIYPKSYPRVELESNWYTKPKPPLGSTFWTARHSLDSRITAPHRVMSGPVSHLSSLVNRPQIPGRLVKRHRYFS